MLWNAVLVTSAVVLAINGVIQIIAPEIFGSRGATMFAVVSILTLVNSLLVASANYPVRALQYFRAYRDLQRFWAELDSTSVRRMPDLANWEARYQRLLDEVPNHTQADFRVAFPPRLRAYWAWKDRRARSRLGARGSSRPPYVATESHELLLLGPWAFARLRVLSSWAFTYLPLALAVLVALTLIPTVRWFLSE
ncbi:hypothetical protein HDC94_000509 [Leifsonia sp. AK011]|nr:hypothetical protein [Leifsonia sp. AK011]